MADNAVLERPIMADSEAARQLGIPHATLKNWLDGHHVGTVRYEPVLREESRPGSPITWGEIVEASYLRAYRKSGVSLQRIRPFIAAARTLFGIAHPLAHLRPFVGDGRRLLLEAQDQVGLGDSLRAVVELTTGQIELDHRAWRYVIGLDFAESEVASRIHLAGPDEAVVIDPAISSGASTVHGIRTEVLAEQASAGASIDEIVADFRLSRADVAAALKHEYSLSA